MSALQRTPIVGLIAAGILAFPSVALAQQQINDTRTVSLITVARSARICYLPPAVPVRELSYTTNLTRRWPISSEFVARSSTVRYRIGIISTTMIWGE